jgi:hypothetical protein
LPHLLLEKRVAPGFEFFGRVGEILAQSRSGQDALRKRRELGAITLGKGLARRPRSRSEHLSAAAAIFGTSDSSA